MSADAFGPVRDLSKQALERKRRTMQALMWRARLEAGSPRACAHSPPPALSFPLSTHKSTSFPAPARRLLLPRHVVWCAENTRSLVGRSSA